MKRKAITTTLLVSGLLGSLCCGSVSAQTYQNDYTMQQHILAHGAAYWLQNAAVYRDDAVQQYYVAQMLREYNQPSAYLALSICDKDMNMTTTWRYHTNAALEVFTVKGIDEIKDLESILVVGDYVSEGSIQAPFAISIDKKSGSVNWFKLFPELKTFSAVKASGDYAVITGEHKLDGVPVPGDRLYAETSTAAMVMRIDGKTGKQMWERQFEDGKYASNPYGVFMVFNTLYDVTETDKGKFAAVGYTNNLNGGESDALLVTFDGDGNIGNSKFLGNLQAFGNGQQTAQYEEAHSVTYDPSDGTIVIAGRRYEDPTIQFFTCELSKDKGLWVTKLDPATLTPAWSNMYSDVGSREGNLVYSARIDQDGKGNYGLVYGKMLEHKPVVSKLDNGGGLVYSRDHFMSGGPSIGAMELKDITRGFEYNNMMTVGWYEPDMSQYYSALGWNVEAYDHIVTDCESNDFPVAQRPVSYETDDVEWFERYAHDVDAQLISEVLPSQNDPVCAKELIGEKKAARALGGVTGTLAATVGQDETTRRLRIRIEGLAVAVQQPSEPFKAVLFNALGQRVLETPGFDASCDLDAACLPAGVYYLTISGNGFRQTRAVSLR